MIEIWSYGATVPYTLVLTIHCDKCGAWHMQEGADFAKLRAAATKLGWLETLALRCPALPVPGMPGRN